MTTGDEDGAPALEWRHSRSSDEITVDNEDYASRRRLGVINGFSQNPQRLGF